MVLLYPAWKKYGMARTGKADTVMQHSRADDVVPFAVSEELVRNSVQAWWAWSTGRGRPTSSPAPRTPGRPNTLGTLLVRIGAIPSRERFPAAAREDSAEVANFG